MLKTAVAILYFAVFVAMAYPASGEDKDLTKLFAGNNINGVIILTDLSGLKTYISDDHRAKEPFVPASTFKILNTLIALEEGVVTEKDVVKWDGKNRAIEAWNRDQTLETAFKSSCVWFYQELARRIGTARYEAYFKKVDYGTGLPTPGLTTFWLEGDLKINAIDQVKFLKKLYRKELPFRDSSYEMLRKIMIIEKTPAYTLRAKSGWSQQIGWYVGYVESGKEVWFFATNMEIKRPEDVRLRQQLTLEALILKGIIPKQ
jgi:beta-lactamase class D